jgi:hypothetical protein
MSQGFKVFCGFYAAWNATKRTAVPCRQALVRVGIRNAIRNAPQENVASTERQAREALA